ncbi:hypothetical protein ACTXT7_007591 [Hymenolepis weldensis]
MENLDDRFQCDFTAVLLPLMCDNARNRILCGVHYPHFDFFFPERMFNQDANIHPTASSTGTFWPNDTSSMALS